MLLLLLRTLLRMPLNTIIKSYAINLHARCFTLLLLLLALLLWTLTMTLLLLMPLLVMRLSMLLPLLLLLPGTFLHLASSTTIAHPSHSSSLCPRRASKLPMCISRDGTVITFIASFVSRDNMSGTRLLMREPFMHRWLMSTWSKTMFTIWCR